MAVIDEMCLDNRSTVFFFQSIFFSLIWFCKNPKKNEKSGSVELEHPWIIMIDPHGGRGGEKIPVKTSVINGIGNLCDGYMQVTGNL